MEAAADRRIRAISGHLRPASDARFTSPPLLANPAAGEFFQEQGYSVILPEKLHDGRWNVYRSARSPLKLVARSPERPDVGTLHDNFERLLTPLQPYSHYLQIGLPYPFTQWGILNTEMRSFQQLHQHTPCTTK